MLKAVLNTFFFLSFLTLSAQSSGYLHWQHLSIADHLQNPANSFLFKDSKDFLWIGSSSGLQRYDGFQVKNFGILPVDSLGMLGENIQGQIVEDENNDLWITTYQSLNHLDIEKEIFTPYPIRDVDGNAISGFHSCGKVGNTIWLLHENHLRQFDIPTREFTTSIKTGTNNFNRGTVKKIGDKTMVYLHYFGGDLLVIYEFIDGELKNTREINTKNSFIYAVHPISETIFLIGCKDELGKSGLKEINIDSLKNNRSILSKKQPLETVVGISTFNENELLITTVTGDLFRYSLKKKELVGNLNFDKFKKSGSSKEILTALVDKEQNIWVSTRSDGVYFTCPDKIKFDNLLAGSIVTNLIQRKNGEIWVFTNKKIFILNKKGEVIRELNSDQLNYDNVAIYHVLNDQKGRLWTNYYIEEQYVKPDSYDFVKLNRLNYIIGSLSLKDGRIIFMLSGRKGLFTVQEQNNQFNLVQIPGTDEIVESVPLYQNPQGEVIVLEESNKITFYNPIDFAKINSVNYAGWIYDMLTIPGDSILWIGGANGLVSFNYNTQSLIYHNKDGKLPKEVFGILPDDQGNLWLSTNDGIYRFTPKTNEIIAYDQADGIGSKRFSMGGHIKLEDGRLAFGGDNGLVIFDPKEIKSKIPSAVPQITNILIDSKKRTDLFCKKTGATNIESIEKLFLKPKDNKLEFQMVAIEYSNCKENLVRYRMTPDESQWSVAKSGDKCQYTNLVSGDHQFEVQAANSDGIWNTVFTDRIAITILPRFYETTWFRILIFFLIGLVFFLIATWIQKQKRRKEKNQYDRDMALEKERLRIARDMHDDLGSRLSAISLKTAMLETKFEDPKWKKEMEKLTLDAQQISITIRETIWAVDARNDSLGKLVHYLISYTEQLFDGIEETEYAFNIAEGLPEEQMVSGKIRRMVFLSFKEILNNIIKHARASEVLIEMKMEKDHFILTITDNGIGFDLAEKEQGRGNGLDNMRYRMEKIGGTCRFLPTDKGTMIELNFNFINRN